MKKAVLRFNQLKLRRKPGYGLEVMKMSIKHAYLNGLMERVIARNPAEPEFHQAVREVLTSLVPVVEARP